MTLAHECFNTRKINNEKQNLLNCFQLLFSLGTSAIVYKLNGNYMLAFILAIRLFSGLLVSFDSQNQLIRNLNVFGITSSFFSFHYSFMWISSMKFEHIEVSNCFIDSEHRISSSTVEFGSLSISRLKENDDRKHLLFHDLDWALSFPCLFLGGFFFPKKKILE